VQRLATVAIPLEKRKIKLHLLPYFDWELVSQYKDSARGRSVIEVPASFKLWLRFLCFSGV